MKHRGILLLFLLSFALLSRVGPSRPSAERPVAATAGQDGKQGEPLVAQLAESGIRLDLERGVVSVPARVLVRQDLLEYLLVSERGATHESMLLTTVPPSIINIALLALGVEKGANARLEPVEPPPSEDEMRAGAAAYDVVLPTGDGFLLYLAWREGDETYLYRVDDLITNLTTGRSLRRHRWVYLGSRFARVRPDDEEESFIADMEGNLINLSFFYQGNTLVTAALPQCIEQTIWVANNWLLPPFESPVSLIFARERLDGLPPAWEESLPVVAAPADPTDGK